MPTGERRFSLFIIRRHVIVKAPGVWANSSSTRIIRAKGQHKQWATLKNTWHPSKACIRTFNIYFRCSIFLFNMFHVYFLNASHLHSCASVVTVVSSTLDPKGISHIPCFADTLVALISISHNLMCVHQKIPFRFQAPGKKGCMNWFICVDTIFTIYRRGENGHGISDIRRPMRHSDPFIYVVFGRYCRWLTCWPRAPLIHIRLLMSHSHINTPSIVCTRTHLRFLHDTLARGQNNSSSDLHNNRPLHVI